MTWTRALARRERLCLLGMIAASTIVHTAVAFRRPTPLYYPDEYIYSALARSIASTGLPTVRGASAHFPAILGPYLMAPAWLIHNVDVAYRVALGWGSFWFSLAALPAFALAKRLGISPVGALTVALMTLLIPDAVYTTTLMSEPYAYPLFIVAVLVAVETSVRPTRVLQLSLLALFLALTLTRLELVVFPAAYVLASLATSRWSVRSMVRAQPVLITGLVLAAASVLAVGVHRLAGYYAGSSSHYHFHFDLLRWYGLDLFVLLIASGWVVFPGACLGFAHLVRGTARQRSFAILSLALVVALLAVAAPYGADEGRVYERYFFYGTPLIVLAFVWSAEHLERTRRYAVLAYVAAACGLVLPIVNGIRDAYDDMSPTLLGLGTIGGSSDASTLVWAVALAVIAVVVGLRIGGRVAAPLLALVVVATVGAMGTESLLGFGSALGARLNMSPGIPRLQAPPDSALITSSVTNRWLLMKTLFWNRNVTRVLVLGGGPATDGFAATDIRLEPGKGLVDDRGRTVPGPFAVDADTVAASASTFSRHQTAAGVLEHSPDVVVFGWSRTDRYLGVVSWLYAAANRRPLALSLAMTSQHGPKSMSFDCGGAKKTVVVGSRPTPVRLRVAAGRPLACRISLVRGVPVAYRGQTVSVRAGLVVRVSRARAT